MITKLSIKNFRLLRDVTIDVERGKPIVLIGPNSSGKSSVLQVLDLLGRAAEDGLEKGLLAFGGGSAVANGMSFFGGTVYKEWLYRRDPAGEIQLLSRQNADLWAENQVTKSRDELSIDRKTDLSFQLLKQRALYPALSELRSRLTGIRVYDGFLTTPLWARDVREGQLSPFDSAVLAPVPRIDRRGLSLVNALYHLQSDHAEVWEELLHALRAEFPYVTRLEFPADPAGGRIALGWRDRRYPGIRMQGHQMSEGMASYLCLLAAILSPEPALAIAFDEPNAQLHPSALRRVVDLLERASKRTAVFIATHSDRFLDYLSDPAGSLRICEPSEEGVTIQTVDRDALEEWRKDYLLSELRERGHLDSSNASGVEP